MKKRYTLPVTGAILTMALMATTFGTAFAGTAPEPAAPAIAIAEAKISQAEAIEKALADAALTKEAVTFSKQTNEFSDGRNLYEIDFIIPGEVKYDYKVDALTGDLLERETDPWEADDNADYQGLLNAGQDLFLNPEALTPEFIKGAADTALNAVQKAEADGRFYKAGLNYEDGQIVYEIGFLLPGEVKFDFDIDPKTGMIIDTDQDLWDAEDDAEYKGLLTPQAADAAPAPQAAGEVTTDQAMAIALQDAGFAQGDVNFVKTEREFSDDYGVEKYDIDFFGPDGLKYEYDIRVADGVILDKDAEVDD